MNQASNHTSYRNTRKAIVAIFTFVALTLLSAGAGFADTLNLQTLPGNTFHNYYVGAVLGNLNGGSQMGFVCDDFDTTTYVPSSFSVTVSTMADLSATKWHDQEEKYKEAAWLLTEMKKNPDKVGLIQFAIWEIFDAATPDYGQAVWITNAEKAVKTGSYDYSSVRIYTPVGNVNQEFMSGGTSPVPVPASVLLLAPGLVGMIGFRKRIWK